MVYSAASGHPGGSLSITDVFTALYFKELNIDVNNPKDENRDRVVLSKGHCSPALYSTLAEKGFFDKKDLNTTKFYTLNELEGSSCTVYLKNYLLETKSKIVKQENRDASVKIITAFVLCFFTCSLDSMHMMVDC